MYTAKIMKKLMFMKRLSKNYEKIPVFEEMKG